MSNKAFTDLYGDDVNVGRYAGVVDLEIDERDGDVASAAFQPDGAIAVGEALIEAAGGSIPPKDDGSIVRAADVSWNEALLRVAKAHNRPVQFKYAKGAGAIIEPRKLIPQSFSDGVVTGYDPDRGGIRAYRLDRIRGEVAAA